jgi:hypothetical protein
MIWTRLKKWLMGIGMGLMALLALLLHRKGVAHGRKQGRKQATQDLSDQHHQIITKITTVQEAKHDISQDNVATKLNDFFS